MSQNDDLMPGGVTQPQCSSAPLWPTWRGMERFFRDLRRDSVLWASENFLEGGAGPPSTTETRATGWGHVRMDQLTEPLQVCWGCSSL
jgi:hypothetical protein